MRKDKVHVNTVVHQEPKTLNDLSPAKSRHYPSGQILVFEGDVVEQLGWIRSGYVKAYKINSDGSMRIICILSPGMVYPIFILPTLRREPSRYFYEAMTSVAIDLTALKESQQYIGGSKVNILAEISELTQSLLADAVDVLSAPKAEDRIRQLLSKLTHWLADTDNQLATLKVKLTQQDIADMSGLTRETASMVMQRLKDEKSIWHKGPRLVIDASKILGSNK